MNKQEVTDKIYNKLQIRKFAKENSGVEINMKSEQKENTFKDLCDNLESVNRHWHIEDEFEIKSHRRVIGRFIVLYKKFVRKMLRWYITPMIRQINIYNSYNTKTLNYIKVSIENLNDIVYSLRNIMQLNEGSAKIGNELIDINIKKYFDVISKNIEALNMKISKFDENEIMDLTSKLEKLEISFDKIVNSSNAINVDKLKDDIYINAYKSYINLKKDTDLEMYMAALSNSYDEKLFEDAIQTFRNNTLKIINGEESNSVNNSIAILCKNFKIENNMEAIKKEAYELYNELKIEYGEKVKFVSIEDQDKIEKEENGIYYISKNKVINHIKKINPFIIHIFESNPHVLFSENEEFFKYNILFSITGQEPFPELPVWALDELRHFNDNGKIKFVVESNYCAEQFVKNGFKKPHIIYPIIKINDIQYEKDINQSFTVGFASSPMQQDQIKNRGMELLSEVIRSLPQLNFKIAWRNEELALPEYFTDLNNLNIQYGKIDMNKFYDSVDCIIIPYINTENNHGCPLSAVEAMMRGIPVISTDVSGIADIVTITGMGVVCKPNVGSVNDALLVVKNNYTDYTEKNKQNKVLDIFNKDKSISIIKELYSEFVFGQLPMIKKWNDMLANNGKYLVKGNDNIKYYYSQQKIAENYNDDRFKDYPMNLYNAFEREAVDVIIESLFTTKDLTLLDIATGDGRILDRLTKYGECSALDNSKEMLKIVLNKYGDSENLKIIKGDYFNYELTDKFDVITSFRYIRHFEYSERKKIYEKIKLNLKDNGVFIFDIPNIEVELKLREISGWSNFNIYDVFWTKETLAKEMNENGFELKYFIPIGEKLMEVLPVGYRNKPVSWVAGVSKRVK